VKTLRMVRLLALGAGLAATVALVAPVHAEEVEQPTVRLCVVPPMPVEPEYSRVPGVDSIQHIAYDIQRIGRSFDRIGRAIENIRTDREQRCQMPADS
jgi:hypothetical protein